MDRKRYIMSILNFSTGAANDVDTSAKADAHSNGLIGRLFDAIAKARAAQARREVNRYLARQPDRLLHDMGLDDQAIAELRWKDAA